MEDFRYALCSLGSVKCSDRLRGRFLPRTGFASVVNTVLAQDMTSVEKTNDIEFVQECSVAFASAMIPRDREWPHGPALPSHSLGHTSQWVAKNS